MKAEERLIAQENVQLKVGVVLGQLAYDVEEGIACKVILDPLLERVT